MFLSSAQAVECSMGSFYTLLIFTRSQEPRRLERNLHETVCRQTETHFLESLRVGFTKIFSPWILGIFNVEVQFFHDCA